MSYVSKSKFIETIIESMGVDTPCIINVSDILLVRRAVPDDDECEIKLKDGKWVRCYEEFDIIRNKLLKDSSIEHHTAQNIDKE